MPEDIRNKLYEVKFEFAGTYRKGDVVFGHKLASDQNGMEYMLRVGAVVPSSVSEEAIASETDFTELISRKDMQITQLQMVIDQRTATIDSLNDHITDLEATVANDNKQKDIETLTARVNELEVANASLIGSQGTSAPAPVEPLKPAK